MNFNYKEKIIFFTNEQDLLSLANEELQKESDEMIQRQKRILQQQKNHLKAQISSCISSYRRCQAEIHRTIADVSFDSYLKYRIFEVFFFQYISSFSYLFVNCLKDYDFHILCTRR